MPIGPPKKRRPYSHVKTDVDSSKAQITSLLRDYGAEGVSWIENFKTGQVELQFAVSHEDGSLTKYKVRPAAFKETHRSWDSEKGKEVQVVAPNWPRAMRLMFYWLKTKLESIAFGLTSTEEEFLAQRVVWDAKGSETTVGEAVLDELARTGNRLAIEAPKARERPGVQDAEARVVGR